jgi:hypothetical protein
MDGQSPLWGIPQDKFASLEDSSGKPLPFAVRYAVYNNYIDFHSVNDVFTRPFPFGKGIQYLRELGQRVVHATSFMEAPIRFGSEVKPGSTFRNGEVSLEFKGVGFVDDALCALLTYDAGQSKLRFVVPIPPNKEGITNGLSLYKGDIYVDLASRWVRRATLDEYMTQRTAVTGENAAKDEFTVRHVVLHLIE